MSDLVGWIHQQIDVDEVQVAAMQREQMRAKTAPIFQGHPLGWLAGVNIFVSPARWQREIEAKRTILALHKPREDYKKRAVCDYCADLCHSRSGLLCDDPDAPYPCDAVQLITAVYADRPGYAEATGAGK